MKRPSRTTTLLGVGVIAAAGITGVVASGVGQGPMRITQEAVDLYNRDVDTEAVGWWRQVCAARTRVDDAVDGMLRTAETTIGHGEDAAGAMWVDAAGRFTGELHTIQATLTELDAHAPTVIRPDGNPEDTDYHGALLPLVDAIASASTRVEQAAGLPMDSRADGLLNAAGTVRADTAGAMTKVADGARLYGEATFTAVTEDPACRELFTTPSVDDGKTIDTIVKWRVTADETHDEFITAIIAAIEAYNTADRAAGPDENVAVAITGIRHAATAGAEKLTAITPPAGMGNGYRQAVANAQPFITRLVDVYTRITEDPIRIDDYDSISAALGDWQVMEAQAVTAIATRMPVATTATAKQIEHQLKKKDPTYRDDHPHPGR